MFVQVNGISLYCEKTGSGRPLVMVHGNGEDHTIFDKAVEVLRDHFECYCIDSRGHGLSSPAAVLHYEDMAEDVICLMEQLDLKDAVFYGFSDGGITGLLASARCSRITSLIISGANLNPRGIHPFLRILFRIQNIFRKDPKLLLMLREPDIGDDLLKSISARTLVLAGSRDLVSAAQTRRIASLIPSAALKILSGETHGSYIVHNSRIGELIVNYVFPQRERPDSDPV